MKDKILSKLINIIILFVYISYLGTLIDNQKIITFSNYLIVVISFIFILIIFLYNNIKKILIGIGFIIIILIKISISKIFFQQEAYIRNIIYIIIIFLCLLCIEKIYINKSNLKFMFNLNLIVTIIFFISSFNNKLYSYENSLDLNFSNPNVAGFVLLTNFIVLNLAISLERKKYKVIFLYIVMSLNLYIIYLTNSRSTFFSSIIFILILNFLDKNMVKKLTLLLSIAPILVVVFSKYINKVSIFISNILNYKANVGLNNRDYIWENSITEIFENSYNFLFGTSNQIIENTHNAYLYLMHSFGIIITIIFLIIFIKRIYSIKIINNFDKVRCLSIGILFLNNSFETHLFRGIIGTTMIFLIIFTKYKDIEKKEGEYVNNYSYTSI